jgi:hypothetical protein
MFVLDQSFKAAVGLAANAASGVDACCGATSAAQQRRVDGGEPFCATQHLRKLQLIDNMEFGTGPTEGRRR